MTLDENGPLVEHRALIDDWRVLAARTEAEDRAAYRRDLEDRDACESVEARETHWVGVMAAMPEHVKRTLYMGDHG